MLRCWREVDSLLCQKKGGARVLVCQLEFSGLRADGQDVRCAGVDSVMSPFIWLIYFLPDHNAGFQSKQTPK